MNQQLLDQLIRLLESSSLSEIEHQCEGERIRLVKGSRAEALPSAAGRPAATAAAPEISNAQAAAHAISSSLVGLFYAASAPGEAPFVQVGDEVREGQPLGIIEAMKMLNLIEADRDGRIVRICVEDGIAVEAGTVLFEIAPLGESDV
ncbi:acetyl-CoA carboxylase biotin carboxyl carrier protein [Pseudomonas sp. BN414]|uniref:acetyl-CoA carboxylase biotin carboxyl carrier protein n=1 Tax=Pseudomonas sp. BN414 TaxID=2567888 RepID=UPI0024541361|nr:biotin/lipoyl-containing protein [Pseudomonas sp. BN414]MDH4567054.1 acetyl-CoA carboxylase biotin carboxyl carrier protein [Pseudomonas sp. BN414]